MQSEKKISILGYITWLLKKYNELKQSQENNIYRIIEINQYPSGQAKIIAQVVGKSSIIECSPQEIVATDRLLEGFSKKDVRTITYLACDEIKKPRYKIIMQDFCEKFNNVIFKLKEAKSEKFIIKTASQIVMDKNLLENMSQADINSVSYVAGYECSQNQACFSVRNIEENGK